MTSTAPRRRLDPNTPRSESIPVPIAIPTREAERPEQQLPAEAPKGAPLKLSVRRHRAAVNENASIPACGWYERRRLPVTRPYARGTRPRRGTGGGESCAFRIEFGPSEPARRRRDSSQSDRLRAALRQGVHHRDPGAGLRTTRSQPAAPPRRLPRSEPASSLAEKVRFDPAPHFFPALGCRRAGIQSFAPALDLRRPRLFHIVSTLAAFRIQTGNQPSGDLRSVLFWKFEGVLENALCGCCHEWSVPARTRTAKRRAEPVDRARREKNARLIGTALDQ